MKIKEITCNRWFLADWIKGITLYPFIFYNGEPNKTLRKHEWIHIDQIRKEGVIKFYSKYLWYNFSKGYKKNPYEIEAYSLQNKQRKEFV